MPDASPDRARREREHPENCPSALTICSMTPVFSATHIAALCRLPANEVMIDIVTETGSTNADLLAQLDRLHGPTLLVAASQTAGRGRAGRSWLSAPDAALTFSLAWKFERPVQALVGLPLAVGVAIAEALAEFEVRVMLKWPNDVLKDGRKLAGILIETALSNDRQHGADAGVWAVIGVGLNLAIPDSLEAQIGQPVASVPWLAQLDRNTLMAALLNHLAQALSEFSQYGFAAFRDRWNALHAYAELPVTILDRGQVVQEGIAAGVDDMGRLLLDTDRGRQPVVAGDVSLRARGV
jgi:BirA family transcriptional regulator, biotin operon repressor / biotin---[acetyl-CoA-carboxylase] ligase